MTDLYAILEVKPDAIADAIEKAYRRRAKTTHPDRGGTEEEFHAVDQAYLVLKDPSRRATYDETGQIDEPRPDNATADAMMLISFYLRKILGTMREAHQDPKKDSILVALKHVISEVRVELEKQKTAAKQFIETSKIAAERFEAKDGPNMIAEFIAFSIAESERSILLLEAEQEKAKRALEILEHYTYRVDKVDCLFMPGSWRTTSTTGPVYANPFYTPKPTRDGEY